MVNNFIHGQKKQFRNGDSTVNRLSKITESANGNYMSGKSGFTGKSNLNSVTSPSANIDETGNEQEVPPFKPMIIKSNSQAIGGNYECKTTTKKSPKGSDLERINILKDAVGSLQIQAKLPSSTTNQSTSTMGINISRSFNVHESSKTSVPFAQSYGALGTQFGVGQGPIKINQKISMNGSTSKKGITSAKKSNSNTQGTSSSQKMKISKTHGTGQLVTNSTLKNLSSTYQQRLAEQRASKNSSTHA